MDKLLQRLLDYITKNGLDASLCITIFTMQYNNHFTDKEADQIHAFIIDNPPPGAIPWTFYWPAYVIQPRIDYLQFYINFLSIKTDENN